MDEEKKLQKFKQRFKKINKLGEGAYGEVFKCEDLEKKEVIALKKIKLENENEGIPASTLREISILQKLNHENLVNLKEIQYSIQEQKLFLIFDFYSMDYKQFIDTKLDITNKSQLKKHMFQILKGLDYMHSQGVLHRDMKPQNLLINDKEVIKIADLGLSRCVNQPLKPYTQEVQTLWYRAPELILGDPVYSVNVDMWSLGCIYAEMLLKKPLVKGQSQIDQLFKVFQLLGSPSVLTYHDLHQLPHYRPTYPHFQGSTFDSVFSPVRNTIDPLALDLIRQLLVLNPLHRLTAAQALQHPYFNDFANQMDVEQ